MNFVTDRVLVLVQNTSGFCFFPRETTVLTSRNFNVHSQGSQKTVSSK